VQRLGARLKADALILLDHETADAAVTQLVARRRHKVLREEQGTQPNVYFLT
jgi:hypothetical protein